MRLYPDVLPRRATAILTDLAAVLAVVLFAWLGLAVHDAVSALGVLGEGVQDAGGLVRDGFGEAADAVGGAPVVGDDVAEGLREAGAGSGGELVDLGRQGERGVERLADLLGLLAFGLPSLAVAALVVPRRVREVRALTAAHRVLGSPDDPGRRRALAQRAAFGLPYGRLLRHSRDPLGDLAAGRLEPLVAAAFEDAGLRPRGRAGPGTLPAP